MPLNSAADGMIRAFQMGLMEKRAAEDQVAEQERKKIEVDLLQHRVKQMKLEERIRTWDMNVKGAQAKAQSMEGLPTAEMPEAQRPGQESKDLSGVMSGLMPSAQQAQTLAPAPTMVAPIPANQPMPRPQAIVQPGFVDAESGINIAPIDLRPQTREQQDASLVRGARLKESVTPRTLTYGQKVVMDGKVIAANTDQDPRDIETVRHNKAIEAEGRAREGRMGRESKDFITATIAQKAAQDLYANLDAIEAAFAPDPKAMEAYQASLEIWNNPTAEELKARTAASKPPQPPNPRLTAVQLEAKKLSAVNSYRAQMHLPKLSRLPPDWTPQTDVEPPPAPAPASSQAPVAPPAAAPIVINTPQGPFRFTDPAKAAAFANAAGVPPPAAAASSSPGVGRDLLGVLSAVGDAVSSGAWDSKTNTWRKSKPAQKK